MVKFIFNLNLFILILIQLKFPLVMASTLSIPHNNVFLTSAEEQFNRNFRNKVNIYGNYKYMIFHPQTNLPVTEKGGLTFLLESTLTESSTLFQRIRGLSISGRLNIDIFLETLWLTKNINFAEKIATQANGTEILSKTNEILDQSRACLKKEIKRIVKESKRKLKLMQVLIYIGQVYLKALSDL